MSTPRTRHAWCRPKLSAVEHQGLILSEQWEERDGVIGARVQYVVEATRKVSIEWLPRERLRPVESQPFTGSAYG